MHIATTGVIITAVRVRTASSAELDQLLAAYEWLFAPPGKRPAAWDPAAAADRLRLAIEADDMEVLVADVDGRVAGICTIYIDIESVRFGRRAWIEDLAVSPDRRSLGIGRALLDEAKAWARDHGASHLELDSALTRTDAHRFYEREGAPPASYSFGWEL